MAKQSMNKTWTFLIVGFLIVVAVILIISSVNNSSKVDYITQDDKININYSCDDGKSIEAVFVDEDDSYVELTLSDGRALYYPQELDSEQRYAKTYGETVFWTDRNEAWLEEDGNRTYNNCVASN